MKVLVGGAAAIAVAMLAVTAVAGGLDVPETEPSVVVDGDVGGAPDAETNPQDGTDEAAPGGGDPDDSSSDGQPTHNLVGATTGGVSDEVDSNLVTDISVFLPGGDTDQPVDAVPTPPTDEEGDPSVTITLTSDQQPQPSSESDTGDIVIVRDASQPGDALGTSQHTDTPEVDASSTRGDDGMSCRYVPDREAVLCE